MSSEENNEVFRNISSTEASPKEDNVGEILADTTVQTTSSSNNSAAAKDEGCQGAQVCFMCRRPVTGEIQPTMDMLSTVVSKVTVREKVEHETGCHLSSVQSLPTGVCSDCYHVVNEIDLLEHKLNMYRSFLRANVHASITNITEKPVLGFAKDSSVISSLTPVAPVFLSSSSLPKGPSPFLKSFGQSVEAELPSSSGLQKCQWPQKELPALPDMMKSSKSSSQGVRLVPFSPIAPEVGYAHSSPRSRSPQLSCQQISPRASPSLQVSPIPLTSKAAILQSPSAQANEFPSHDIFIGPQNLSAKSHLVNCTTAVNNEVVSVSETGNMLSQTPHSPVPPQNSPWHYTLSPSQVFQTNVSSTSPSSSFPHSMDQESPCNLSMCLAPNISPHKMEENIRKLHPFPLSMSPSGTLDHHDANPSVTLASVPDSLTQDRHIPGGSNENYPEQSPNYTTRNSENDGFVAITASPTTKSTRGGSSHRKRQDSNSSFNVTSGEDSLDSSITNSFLSVNVCPMALISPSLSGVPSYVLNTTPILSPSDEIMVTSTHGPSSLFLPMSSCPCLHPTSFESIMSGGSSRSPASAAATLDDTALSSAPYLSVNVGVSDRSVASSSQGTPIKGLEEICKRSNSYSASSAISVSSHLLPNLHCLMNDSAAAHKLLPQNHTQRHCDSDGTISRNVKSSSVCHLSPKEAQCLTAKPIHMDKKTSVVYTTALRSISSTLECSSLSSQLEGAVQGPLRVLSTASDVVSFAPLSPLIEVTSTLSDLGTVTPVFGRGNSSVDICSLAPACLSVVGRVHPPSNSVACLDSRQQHASDDCSTGDASSCTASTSTHGPSLHFNSSTGVPSPIVSASNLAISCTTSTSTCAIPSVGNIEWFRTSVPQSSPEKVALISSLSLSPCTYMPTTLSSKGFYSLDINTCIVSQPHPITSIIKTSHKTTLPLVQTQTSLPVTSYVSSQPSCSQWCSGATNTDPSLVSNTLSPSGLCVSSPQSSASSSHFLRHFGAVTCTTSSLLPRISEAGSIGPLEMKYCSRGTDVSSQSVSPVSQLAPSVSDASSLDRPGFAATHLTSFPIAQTSDRMHTVQSPGTTDCTPSIALNLSNSEFPKKCDQNTLLSSTKNDNIGSCVIIANTSKKNPGQSTIPVILDPLPQPVLETSSSEIRSCNDMRQSYGLEPTNILEPGDRPSELHSSEVSTLQGPGSRESHNPSATSISEVLQKHKSQESCAESNSYTLSVDPLSCGSEMSFITNRWSRKDACQKNMNSIGNGSSLTNSSNLEISNLKTFNDVEKLSGNVEDKVGQDAVTQIDTNDESCQSQKHDDQYCCAFLSGNDSRARPDEQKEEQFSSATAQGLGFNELVKCSPDLSKCSDNGPSDKTNQKIKQNSDSFHDKMIPNNDLVALDCASMHTQTPKCLSQQIVGVAVSADNLQPIRSSKKENIQKDDETNEDGTWNDATAGVSNKKRLRGRRNSQICDGEVKRVTRSVTRNLKNNCTQDVASVVQRSLKRIKMNEPSEKQGGSAEMVTSVSDISLTIDVPTSSNIFVNGSLAISTNSAFSENLKKPGKPNDCVHLADGSLSRQGSSFQHSISLSSSSGSETTAVFAPCTLNLASGPIENEPTVSSVSMDYTLSGNSIRSMTSSHLGNDSKFIYGETNFQKGFCDRSLQVEICENVRTSDKSKVVDEDHPCVKSSFTSFLPLQSVSTEIDFEADTNLFPSYPGSYSNISTQNYSGDSHRPSKAITEPAPNLASHTPVLLPPVETSNNLPTSMANYSNSSLTRTASHLVRFSGTNNQFVIHSQDNDQPSAKTIGSQDRIIKTSVNQSSEIDRNAYYENSYEHPPTNKHFTDSKQGNFTSQSRTNDRSLIHKEPSKPTLNTLQSNNSPGLHYVLEHSQKEALSNSLNLIGQTLNNDQSGSRIPLLESANDITIDSLKPESSTPTHPHGTTQGVSYQSQVGRCMLSTHANTSVSVDSHVHRQARSQTLTNSYSQSSNALVEITNNSYVSAIPAVNIIKGRADQRTPLLANGSSNGKLLHCVDNQNQASINCEQPFKQSSNTSPNRQQPFKQSNNNNNNTTFSSVAPYCPTSEACSQTSFPLQPTNFTLVHNQDVVSQLANTSKSHPPNQIQLQTVDHRQVLNYSNQSESAGKLTQKLAATRIETLNSKASHMGGSAVGPNTYSMEPNVAHTNRPPLKTYSEQTCQLNTNQALYSNVNNNYNSRQPSTKNQIDAHTAMKTQIHGQSQHMGLTPMYSDLHSQDAIPMRHYAHVHSQIPYHNIHNNYSAVHDHISIHDHCSNGLLQSAATNQNYETNAVNNHNLNRGLAHTDNRNCSNNYTTLLHNNSLTHRAIGPGQTDHSLASGNNILNHPSRSLAQTTEYHQLHGSRSNASMHTSLEQQQHHVMVHDSSVLPLAQSSVTPSTLQQPSSTHHTNVVNPSDVNLMPPVTVGYNVHLSNGVLHAGTSQQCLRQPYDMQAMNHVRQQGVQRHSKAVHGASYNHATAMSHHHHHNMVGMQQHQQQQHASGSTSVNFNASVHMNRQTHNQGRVRHCELSGLSGNIGCLGNTQLPNQSLQVHGQIEYVGAPVHHGEVNNMVQQQTNLHSHSNNALPAHMVYQDISAHNGSNSMNAQYHHSVGGQLYVPPSYNDLQCMHNGPLQQYAQYQRSKHHSQVQSLSEYVTQSCDMHGHQICYPDLASNSYHGNLQPQITSDKINASYGHEEQFVPVKRELMVGGDMSASSQQHQTITKTQDVRYLHNGYQRNQMSAKHTQVQPSTNAHHSTGTDTSHSEALDVETKHVSSNSPLTKLSLETICLPENAPVVPNERKKPATSLSDDLHFKDSLIHGITQISVAESRKDETEKSIFCGSSSNQNIPTSSISALNNVKCVERNKLTLEASSVQSLASMHAENYACFNDTATISQRNEYQSSKEEPTSVDRQSINNTTPEIVSVDETALSSQTVTSGTSENSIAAQNSSSLIRDPGQDSPIIILTSTENTSVDNCQRDDTFLEPGSDNFTKCSAAANHNQEEGTRPPSSDVDSSGISVGPSSNISINNKAAGDVDIDIEECDCPDDHLLELNTEQSSPLPIDPNQGLDLILTMSRESQEQHAPNNILPTVESSVDPIQSAAEYSKNDGSESDSSDHPSKSTSPSFVDPNAEGAPTSPFPAFDRPSTPPEMLRNVQEATEYHKPTLLMRNFKTKKHAKLQICRQCDQVFSTRHCLVRHIERIHKPNSDQFTCATCHKKFHSDGALARHMQQHKTYPCKLCGVSFMRRVAFKKHIEQHSRESLSCTYCNKDFSTIQALIMHTNTHKKEKPQHVCLICNKKFANNRNLTVHSRIHSGDKPHECPNCNRTFTVKSNMLAHQELCAGKCRFKCDVCDRSFPLQSVLRRHLAEHGGNYHHSCSICKKGFSKASGLKAHMKVHQSVKDDQQAGIASGSQLRPKSSVPRKSKRVGKSSGGVRGPVTCPVCSKQLSRPELLPDHVARHANKKQHQCPDCPRVFYYKNSVRPHQRSAHLREKPHTCTVCRKTFCHKSALKVHAAVHNGQKPHQCGNCGKAFATKSNYKRHLRCHVTLNVEVVEP